MMTNRKSLRIIGGRSLERPEFEATSSERDAIDKFLVFALADIKYQFDEMNHETGHSRSDLDSAQTTAVLLSSYIAGLRTGLDAMKLKETVN